ncbi:trna delta -isopentenylpyrophosphate transferase [Azorhizobium caulinodans]|uniref:trna delta -isopentenylpyrophosphate transferase n=1 Tax=Azorhizobium caulinodans TaxID=7 RepID=UPI002FBEFC59
MNREDIREIFDKFGASLEQDDVWSVQQATVIKHKALERLAAAAGVAFAAPVILRAEADEAVILATGNLGEKTEWSIGEARTVAMVDSGRKNSYGKPIYEAPEGAVGNYQVTPKQAAYPYAMAEKRAKDRVILKLTRLHGLYSEDEADDFKQGARVAVSEPPQVGSGVKERYIQECRNRIAAFKSDDELKAWWASDDRKAQFSQFDLSTDEAAAIKDAASERRRALNAKAAA